ncbi:type II secretion system protein [Lentisphaera profundi]|uniref:Type II secretion system protein n=1 Tax=Lentisphaera profundi TaxID=1658616 RepID=A0ABY7VUH7_9BACT|nr:type II secretion system protein [Lentisphaera profundi]WDE97414.1 type II secretion system protein [Lentisphaera profundi]
MKKINKKFTLIELLVLIAIIGILASFLLPVLSKARKTSRMTVCISQYKQIGLGMFQYVTDSNDILPGDLRYGSNAQYRDDSDKLSGRLAIYMGEAAPSNTYVNNASFLCPSFTKTLTGVSEGVAIQGRTAGTYTDTDGSSRQYFGYTNSYSSVSLNSVLEPSSTVAHFETDDVYEPGKAGGNISVDVRHGYKGFGALRVQLYFDGRVKVLVQRLEL